MLMSGRCGLVLKDEMRFPGGMRVVTPGKWALKNAGSDSGSLSSMVKWEEGKKRVQVNEPSCKHQLPFSL